MKPITMRVVLGGERLRVRVEGSPAVPRWLAQLFGAQRDGGANGRADVEVAGRTVGGRRCATAEELRASIEYALSSKAIARAQRRIVTIHAALVARGRDGALIAGGHGRGKTTLAVALALRRGWRVLADDIVLADADGAARGLERPVRLKPGMTAALPELLRLGVDRRAWRAGWPVLVPLRRLAARGPASVRPRAIVILGSRGRRPMRVKPLPPGLAVAHLARFAATFRDRPRETLKAAAALVRGARAVSMADGTLDERCAAVESLTQGAR